MKRYILFTNEELADLINGREVKLRTRDNGIVYFVSKEHFAKLFGADDAEEKNVTFPRGLRSKVPGIIDDYSRYLEEDDTNEKVDKALEIARYCSIKDNVKGENMYFKKFDNSDMKKFLIEKANLDERNKDAYIGYRHCYHETINPDTDFKSCHGEYYSNYNLDQIADNKYYTYVYRIGVLYMWDGNKCDFAEVHIAFQTDKNSEMLYLGKLDFKNGENMDLETTVKRIAFSMIECVI